MAAQFTAMEVDEPCGNVINVTPSFSISSGADGNTPQQQTSDDSFDLPPPYVPPQALFNIAPVQQQAPSRPEATPEKKPILVEEKEPKKVSFDTTGLHVPKTAGKETDVKLTYVGMVVDRSGSMQTMGSEVAGGINAYLDTQRKTDAEDDGATTLVRLATFDNTYEVLRYVPLKEFPLVTDDDVKPRGCTALHDAIGKIIGEAVVDIERMPKAPGTVVIFILTDGQENGSRKWTKAQVTKQIKLLEAEPYNWEFYFAAANQDAIKEGHSYGITPESCLSWGASPQEMRNTMQNVSYSCSRLKRSAYTNAPKEQRRAAKGFSASERMTSKMRSLPGDRDDLL